MFKWRRIIDIAGAFAGLCLSFLPGLLIAGCIKLIDGGDIFFRQKRVGLNGNPFLMYKFKSMRDIRDDCGRLLPDDRRITKLGPFLRRWSLNELPQIINVLKGEMSLVGPRPLLAAEIEQIRVLKLENELHIRAGVLPGITGLSQVTLRHFDLKRDGSKDQYLKALVQQDADYVRRRSSDLWMDVHILLKTFNAVARGENIAEDTISAKCGSAVHRPPEPPL